MASDEGCCVGMGKFLAFLSFVTFLLVAAGMANPYWLEKEQNDIFIPMPLPLTVTVKLETMEVNIGVLWACYEVKVSGFTTMKEDKCESLADVDADQVEDWQWVAAGLGIGALLGSFVGFILSCVIACTSGPSSKTRASTIFCYFISCVLFVVVAVLFNENKKYSPPVGELSNIATFDLEFDLNWGFYVGAVGAGMLFVMSLLHMFVACGMRNANTIV